MTLDVESLVSALRAPSQVQLPQGSALTMVAPHLVVVSDGSPSLEMLVQRAARSGRTADPELERLGRQMAVTVENPVGEKLTAVSNLRVRANLRHPSSCLVVAYSILAKDPYLQETVRRMRTSGRYVYVYGSAVTVSGVCRLMGLESALYVAVRGQEEAYGLVGVAAGDGELSVRRAAIASLDADMAQEESLRQVLAWEYQGTYSLRRPIQGTYTA